MTSNIRIKKTCILFGKEFVAKKTTTKHIRTTVQESFTKQDYAAHIETNNIFARIVIIRPGPEELKARANITSVILANTSMHSFVFQYHSDVIISWR